MWLTLLSAATSGQTDNTATLQVIIGIATVVVLVLSVPSISKFIESWRIHRRERRDERYTNERHEREKLANRVKVLEEAMDELKTSVKEILAFIRGTPDPFRTDEEGQPIIEGGLVRTLNDILAVIKKSEGRGAGDDSRSL